MRQRVEPLSCSLVSGKDQRAIVDFLGSLRFGDDRLRWRLDLEVDYVKCMVNFFAQHASEAKFTQVNMLRVPRVACLGRRHVLLRSRALPCNSINVASFPCRDQTQP